MFDWLTLEAVTSSAAEWMNALGPAIYVPAGIGLALMIGTWLVVTASRFSGGMGGGSGPGATYSEASGVHRPRRGRRGARSGRGGKADYKINSWEGLEEHARKHNGYTGGDS